MRYLLIFMLLLTSQFPTELSAKSKKPKNQHPKAKQATSTKTFPFVANLQSELRTKIEQSNFPTWMMDQIHEDLEPFKDAGITKQNIEDTLRDCECATPDRAFVVCQIKNNEFSFYPNPQDDNRGQLLVASMKWLAEAIPLPDVLFIVYISEGYYGENNKAPIFTWCKHREKGKKAVCFPDYEALTGNYNLLKAVAIGIQQNPWEIKKNKAIWRGALTGGWGDPSEDYMLLPRVKLAQTSHEFPKLIDAKLTGKIRKGVLPYWTKDKLPIADHLQYKYQILVDGHVSAFSRAYWQLFSNCVMFKQTSPWYQWFYRGLQPYEHYIPYKADASDLAEKIMWARQHDEEVRKISQNANDFANQNLRHSDIMLYVYLLLTEYAKLQKF